MQKLAKGMSVTAPDGWRGKVELNLGEVIACVSTGNGATAGRRHYASRSLRIIDGRAFVDKKARPVTCGANGAECGFKDPALCGVHGERARLERGWNRRLQH